MIDREQLSRTLKATYDGLKALGQDPDDPQHAHLFTTGRKPRVRKELNEQKEAISREAEAVLLHLRLTNTLIQKECQQCHLPFATNYQYVGCCSDDCLATRIKHVTGLDWNPEKTPQERWNGPDVNGEIPAIVRPDSLAALKAWARVILSWDETEMPKVPIGIMQVVPEKLDESWDEFDASTQNGWRLTEFEGLDEFKPTISEEAAQELAAWEIDPFADI